MVLRRLVALVAVLPLMACSSSDVGDGGAPVSDAGAGGSSAGGASAGGAPTTGGATGTGGVSGDAGVSCLGADGHAPPELAACRVDADCETVTVPTCCGSDLVLGVTDPPTCTLPHPDCTGLGCPKNVYVQTEDGALVEPGFAVAARCDYSGGPSLSQGVCRSYRVPFPDCGGSPCEAGEICVHLPPDVGGAGPPCFPVPDSGTCPPGTEPDARCGCVEIPVTPPPVCESIPAACGSVPTCDCLAADLCGGGPNQCMGVSGLDVSCANLAP